MLASLIAERYGKALVQAAGAEQASQEVAAQAGELLKALEASAEADAFFASPVAPLQAKLEALKAAFEGGLHPVLERALRALLENKRGGFVRVVLREAGRRFKIEAGLAEASLATARALKPAQRALIEEELGRQLGRKVELKPLVQPRLLGGAVLRLGDTVYDASLRTQLDKLGSALRQAPPRRAAPKDKKKAAAKKAKASAKKRPPARTKSKK